MQRKYMFLFLVTIAVAVNGLEKAFGKIIKKRSLHYKNLKNNAVAIDSAVDDIKESTAFVDREKKWKALMEGNMYPEHMAAGANKRKEVNDNDDKSDTDSTPETVVGEKKNRIENHNIERDEYSTETLAASDYDDSNDNAESDSNDAESGSGSADDSANAETESDEEPQKEEESTGDRRQEKLKCTKKCAMPMTYHECAHPRCNLKIGSIKDLCFYLCKHQKEKCEDVCE